MDVISLGLIGVGRFLCDFGFVIVPELDHVCGQLVDSSLFLVLVRKLVFVLLVVPLGCAASSPLQWDHSKDESLANLQQVSGCI